MLAKRLMHIYRKLRGRFGYLNWWPADTPFEVVVGAILTQNVSWHNVERSIQNLKRVNLMSLDGILSASPQEIKRCIAPAGYYNVKYKRLISVLSFIDRELNGDIRDLKNYDIKTARQLLLSVDGVGKETADSILLYAVNLPIFVVDAYTRRAFYRLGILSAMDMEYDEIQRVFMKNLKRDVRLYNDYHAQIVELGKNFCRKRPLCGDCPICDDCKRRQV